MLKLLNINKQASLPPPPSPIYKLFKGSNIPSFSCIMIQRYVSWVVGLPVVCDVTKHGRHLVCHLGFYQELEIK